MDASKNTERNTGREARSFFSFLFLFVLIFSLMSLLSACTDGMDETTCGSTLATVRDYTGLDGCGLVLVKDNGEVLEPYLPQIVCVTAPCEYPPEASPTSSLRDGQRVRVGYEETNDVGTICMTGKVVRILCLEEINTNQKD